MSPTDKTTKAKVVSELLADKLVESYLIPILINYKDIVFNILLEEENIESLNILADHLTSSSSSANV